MPPRQFTALVEAYIPFINFLPHLYEFSGVIGTSNQETKPARAVSERTGLGPERTPP
jgi:hypothetical protein